jgi:hypothetical protein
MAQFTLDLNKKLLNSDDAPMKDGVGKDVEMNKVLANELWKPGKENVIKFYDWGFSLWKTGIITFDRTDADLLKLLIERNDWDVFTKGRFLDELSKATSQELKIALP